MLSSQSTPQYFSNLDDAFDSFPPARDDGLECLAAGDVLKEFVDVLRQRDGWNKLTVSGARKRVVKWLEYRREHGGGLDVGDAGAGSDIAEDEQLDQLASLDPAAADAAVDAALSGGVSGGEDVAVEAADVAVEAADAAVEAADAAVGMDVAVEAADAAVDVAAQDEAVEAADVAVDAADAAVGMDVAVEAVEAVVAQDDVVEDSSTPETAAERAERVLVARVDESTRTYTASLVSFLDGVLRGESPDSSGLCLGGVLPVGEHSAPFYRYQVVLRSLLQAVDTLGVGHMSLLESHDAAKKSVGGDSFPSLDDFIEARQGTLNSLKDMVMHEMVNGNDTKKIEQWVQQLQAEKARLESLYETEKAAYEQPRAVVADVLLQSVVQKKKAARGKRKGGNGGEGGSGSSKKKMTNKDLLKRLEQEYCSRAAVAGDSDDALYESVHCEIVHGLIGGQGSRSRLAIGAGYGLSGLHLKACACAQCQNASKVGSVIGVDGDGVNHCPSWTIRMRVVLWTGKDLVMNAPDLDLYTTRKQTNGPQLPLPGDFKSWSQSMKHDGFTGKLTSLHYYSSIVVGRPYVANAEAAGGDVSGLMAGFVNGERSVLLLVPMQMVHSGVVEKLGEYGFSFATSLSGRERLSKEKILALVPNEYNEARNIVDGGAESIFRPDCRTREYKLEQLGMYRGYFHLLEPALRALVADGDWTKLSVSNLELLLLALKRLQQQEAAASAGLASP
jgi:hypothetical protein